MRLMPEVVIAVVTLDPRDRIGDESSTGS